MLSSTCHRFSSGATQELSVLGSVVAALGGLATLVAVFCCLHVPVDIHGDYLDSGYHRKPIEYPIIELRFLKRCLHGVFSSVHWDFESVFQGGVHHRQAEWCKEPQLGDVTF